MQLKREYSRIRSRGEVKDVDQREKSKNMNSNQYRINSIRGRFPYLASFEGTICFDGVGGTQVPISVIDAISRHLIFHNGNKGGIFQRSRKTDEVMDAARAIAADFVNADDPMEIVIGANFTNMTFAFSRAIARTWAPGDEIIVSNLDHDSNVSPWVSAAEDAGCKVRFLDISPDDCQLSPDMLDAMLSDRCRLVAFCAASSSVGTAPNVGELTRRAKAVGAVVYVDAVAYAPHAPIDVKAWGADFVGVSGYKFSGPHISFVWGRRELLESLPAYKIRPAPETLPVKWLNGAQPYELVAGLTAAIEHVGAVGELHADIVPQEAGLSPRATLLRQGMRAIQSHESRLTWELIAGLKELDGYRLWGITDPERANERLPPVAVSLPGVKPDTLARHLDRVGIDVWSRSVYSISLSERLGLEGPNFENTSDGFIRIGISHYNTIEEIRTLLGVLDEFTKTRPKG